MYEIEGAEKGEPQHQIIEDVDVDSWEEWQKVVDSDAMKDVIETWGNYGDESTLRVIYGKKIK